MRKILVVMVLFVGIVSASAQEVKWMSFNKALELSKKNPKPILVDFYTDWCGWCKRMDATTYKNKVIVDYINKNYYPVKINGEGGEDITYKGHTFKLVKQGRNKYHEFAAAVMNGRMSYPTTAFFDTDTNLLQVFPGYQKAKDLEILLAYVVTKSYKKMSGDDFKKSFKSKLK